MCHPSGCTVASGVVRVVGGVSNCSQMRTSNCKCLIFGVSIGIFDRSKFKVTCNILLTISGWLLVSQVCVIWNRKWPLNHCYSFPIPPKVRGWVVCVCTRTCRKVGSEWALDMAKYNLAHNYLVVGTTDELEEFVAILEAGLPRFFSGALEFFVTGLQSMCSSWFCWL